MLPVSLSGETIANACQSMHLADDDRLWEGSWGEGAVVQDSQRSTYTDPSKVRKIEHRGRFFKCVSAHLVDPSPQRTPVLFQAGMSAYVMSPRTPDIS